MPASAAAVPDAVSAEMIGNVVAAFAEWRFMESGAAEWLVIADIQRRAHRFAAGLESCVRAERADSNAALAPFIDFQRRLLAVDDDACHSMAEVARR